MFDRGGRLVSAVVCIAAIGGVAWWVNSRRVDTAPETSDVHSTQLMMLKEMVKNQDLSNLGELAFGFSKPHSKEEQAELVSLLTQAREIEGESMNLSVMHIALSLHLPGTEIWYDECATAEDSRIRVTAARYPRNFEDTEFFLKDEDPEVRATAIMSLSADDVAQTIPVLRHHFDDPSERVRIKCLTKSRLIEDESIAEDIIARFGTGSSKDEALEMLTYFRHQDLHDYADHVLSVTAHEDPLVRAEAILTLRFLTTDDRSDQVVKLIDDPATEVKNAVVSYLLHWDNGSFVKEVEPLLKYPATRQVAESYLSQYRFGKSM